MMPCANHNTNQPTQQQMVQVKLGGLLCVQEQKVYPQDTQPTVVSKKTLYAQWKFHNYLLSFIVPLIDDLIK